MSTEVALRQRNFHRDEFLSCSICKKMRRFKLRDAMECRIFHDANMNSDWVCSMSPYETTSCDHEEERPSRKVARGCPRYGKCKGCSKCICTGCFKCRYMNCPCKPCTEFTQNAWP
ncbi:hypothetical protein ACFE04_023452 [Oxalis oulophora]